MIGAPSACSASFAEKHVRAEQALGAPCDFHVTQRARRLTLGRAVAGYQKPETRFPLGRNRPPRRRRRVTVAGCRRNGLSRGRKRLWQKRDGTFHRATRANAAG